MRAIALALLLPLLTGCTGLIFQPMQQHVIEPQRVGITAEDVYFPAADGTRLHGWFLPAKPPVKGTVLFLHGNAENISTHIASVYWLPPEGFNVFMFDYRGYGWSEGSPSIPGLLSDFQGALQKVLHDPRIDPDRVVVFGQSLGAAITILGVADAKDKDRLRAVVTEGAFTSFRKVAREALADFWLTWPLQCPLSYTINDDYRPVDHVAEISPVPLLIVQSRADQVVALHHAYELYAAAKQPKKLWIFDKAPHIGIFRTKENRLRLVAYLEKAVGYRPQKQVPTLQPNPGQSARATPATSRITPQ